MILEKKEQSNIDDAKGIADIVSLKIEKNKIKDFLVFYYFKYSFCNIYVHTST